MVYDVVPSKCDFRRQLNPPWIEHWEEDVALTLILSDGKMYSGICNKLKEFWKLFNKGQWR
jgi:hypothetical protein